MDLSAIIFVVLALAWAVYLLPKALKHHDEMAGERLVEGHSDKVRILSRRSRTGPEVVEVEVEHVDTVERSTGTQQAPAGSRAGGPAAARPVVTRASARKAARRRRRVLGVLVLGLVVVWALTWLAYLPIWAPAVPGAVVVAFLVVARLSVRRSSAGRRTVPAPRPVVERAVPAEPRTMARTMAEPVSAVEPVETEQSTVVDGLDLLAEETAGVARQQIEAALADDGSLWDPLPVTLPTYVNKARARRTVRTIELTGINSSGHDESDTALAREAEQSSAQPAAGEADSRKVAGA